MLVVAVKPLDPIISRFEDRGYTISRKWPPSFKHRDAVKLVVWPKIDTYEDEARQRDTIQRMLRDVYREQGWCVYLDEAQYVTDYLKLTRDVVRLWRQGRSIGITVVAASQRPRHLPLEAYSQASHLFAWATRDRLDVQRLRDFAGAADPTRVQAALAGLTRGSQHRTLYMGPAGTLVETEAPA